MKVLYTHEFKKRFAKLPPNIKTLFSKQERIFKKNWKDSHLHLKKLSDHPLPFSFRITRGYRVLFVFTEQDVTLFTTIGHRKEIHR